MNRLIKLSVLALATIFLFACNGEKNTEATAKQDTEVAKSISVKIEDVQKDGKLDAFTVKSIAYKASYIFNIKLVGEFEVSGILLFNEYEETTDFNVDESSQPQTKLMVEGTEYPLYSSIQFRNLAQLKDALSAEQKKALSAGQEVVLKLKLKDPIIDCYINKGRIGVASANFILLSD